MMLQIGVKFLTFYFTFWSLFCQKKSGFVVGLICSKCKYKEFSVAPVTAPNSRFVFDAVNDTCDEETVVCLDKEQFCIAASAKSGENSFWVQKGCISSSSSSNNGAVVGSQCVEEYLNSKDVENVTISNRNLTLKMTVCVCNTRNYCNRGYVHEILSNDVVPSSFSSLPKISWFCQLCLFLFNLFSLLKHHCFRL